MNLEALAVDATLGDRAAMERLLEGVYPMVYRFYLKLSRSGMEAQELTQCAMLKLIENLHKYRAGSGRFQSWVFRLSYNLFIDQRRKRSPTPMEDTLLHLLPDTRDGTKEMEGRDAVTRMLAPLPEELRAMVILRYYMELSYTEIARALGTSEKRVKWRLHDAMEQLRKSVKEENHHA